MRRIYFGHDTLDIYTALSIGEILKKESEKNKIIFFRTFQISPPAVTIAANEDISDIFLENCEKDGIHYTRRFSPGSVIYLDENVLAYSVTFPSDYIRSIKLHDHFGTLIAYGLKNLGIDEIYLGEKFSIALSPSPSGVISGNSWEKRNNYGIYHGVLILNGLNVDVLKKYIKLRKNESVDEEKLLRKLPSLRYALKKEIDPVEISENIARRILEEYEIMEKRYKEEIIKKAKKISYKFKDREWINYGKRQKKYKNLGYCLIALSEEWKERNFRRI
jgi:lipoate-protein ligase A